MTKKQRLELTWIGKDKPVKLEPRILIEDPSKSYGDPNSGNMLIHGDNLLALKALEQDYTGKVKCIYIDPPYNTGNAFEHYDDGLEHSIWLNLMYERLKILKNLLSNDGAIFVQIDDNEHDYLKVMMDEIFGRKNFVSRITIEARAPSAFSTVNPGVFKASEYILWFAKNKSQFSENRIRVPRDPDYAYSKWLDNPNDHFSKWSFKSVQDAFEEITKPKSKKPDTLLKNFNKFIVENASQITRLASISDTKAGEKIVELKKQSLQKKDQVFYLNRENLDDVYILNGQQIIFYSKNVSEIDGENCANSPLTNIWSDIAWEGIAGEGGVTFNQSKKPEKLVKRCIEISSNLGDLVLDSFLGSGTTAAVAHKMGRRWIGVELGDHAYTHCKVRMDKVVDGEDQGGITKSVDWKGGGGYKFYELAPSLLKKDKYGNFVIDDQYNAQMLAAAMAKQESFRYCPDEAVYWKQGKSTENDYIYTTTQYLTVELLEHIHDEMKSDESLLICCKAFDEACKNRFPNINIKKIPHMLLGRCEFGKDDYSLNIVNVPGMEDLDLQEDLSDAA